MGEHDCGTRSAMPTQTVGATMCEVIVYPITQELWRWEIRCNHCHRLLYCGTAGTRETAEMEACHAIRRERISFP